MHSVAVLERRRVKIAVHRGTDGVVVGNVAASYSEAVAVAVHHLGVRIVDGKDIDESLLVRITDVLWNCKGELKLPVNNLTFAIIQHCLAVVELHGLVGCILIVVA